MTMLEKRGGKLQRRLGCVHRGILGMGEKEKKKQPVAEFDTESGDDGDDSGWSDHDGQGEKGNYVCEREAAGSGPGIGECDYWRHEAVCTVLELYCWKLTRSCFRWQEVVCSSSHWKWNTRCLWVAYMEQTHRWVQFNRARLNNLNCIMPFGALKGPPWRVQGEVAGVRGNVRRY